MISLRDALTLYKAADLANKEEEKDRVVIILLAIIIKEVNAGAVETVYPHLSPSAIRQISEDPFVALHVLTEKYCQLTEGSEALDPTIKHDSENLTTNQIDELIILSTIYKVMELVNLSYLKVCEKELLSN